MTIENTEFKKLVTPFTQEYANLEQSLSDFSNALTNGIPVQRDQAFILRRVVPYEHLVSVIPQQASQYQQLVSLDNDQVNALAEKGLALCVVTQSGQLASYLGAEIIDENSFGARYGLAEIRSSVTVPGFNKRGFNSILKLAQMVNMYMIYHKLPFAFTDDIPKVENRSPIKSESIGINTNLGLKQIRIDELPNDLKDFLVEPCPIGRCIHKDGLTEGQSPCSCSIWVPVVDKQVAKCGIDIIDNTLSLIWENINDR